MIVTCPNCNCQFKVSADVFGSEGRMVRCSACKNEWLHEPSLEGVVEELAQTVSEEIIDDDEQDFLEDDYEEENDDDAHLEIYEEDIARNTQERLKKFEARRVQEAVSYYIAAGFFFIILIYLLMASTSIMKSYPSMQGFYKFFGIHMDLPSSMSLAFEGVKAEQEGDIVTVSGRIVNLSRSEWKLPMIEVVVFKPVISAEGHVSDELLAKWLESPPEKALSPELETKFVYKHSVHVQKKVHDKHNDDKDPHGSDGKGKHEEMVMARVRFVVQKHVGKPIRKDKHNDKHENSHDHNHAQHGVFHDLVFHGSHHHDEEEGHIDVHVDEHHDDEQAHH